MVKVARRFASESALGAQRISFRGPFSAPGGNVPFLVENDSYVKPELVGLFRQANLDREGIQEFARDIELFNRVVWP
jgi:hypothetical protein